MKQVRQKTILNIDTKVDKVLISVKVISRCLKVHLCIYLKAFYLIDFTNFKHNALI